MLSSRDGPKRKMHHSVLLGLTASLIHIGASQRVEITNGTVQGIKCPDSDAVSFLGLPYAQAPTGNLRYSAPKAYDAKYNGTLQATTQPPNCPQFGSSFVETSLTSEDW